MKNKKKSKKFNYLFLFITIIIYIFTLVLSPENSVKLNKNIISLVGKILPVLILIFFFMFLLELLFPVKKMAELLKRKKSVKLWIISIISGIISTGSIYLWYPILKEFKENGIKEEIIAIFIFNRAIKLQLLPLMILYFGVKYVLVLTLIMIFISIIYGLVFKLIYYARRKT